MLPPSIILPQLGDYNIQLVTLIIQWRRSLAFIHISPGIVGSSPTDDNRWDSLKVCLGVMLPVEGDAKPPL